MDLNFNYAHKNISTLKVKNPQEFNIPEMLQSDYIFMTKKGVEELEMVLENRQGNYFRNRKVSTEARQAEIAEKRQDPWTRDVLKPILDSPEPIDLPLDLVTPSLKQYIDDLRQL